MAKNTEINRNTKLLEPEIIETEQASPEAGVIEKASARGRLFASLYHREFRYLWSGALLSNVGTWIQSVALGWFVWQITRSEFSLGLVYFAASIPTFFLAPLGGVIADRYERRRMLIVGQAAMGLLAFTLGVLISLGLANMASIIALSLAVGIVSSFGFPAWLALIPDTVPRRDLMNAVALNSAQFNAARFVGPAIAGVIVSLWGIAAAFYVNALSFLAVIVALTLIRPAAQRKPDVEENAWGKLMGGVRYARQHTTVAVLLVSIGMLTLFGMSHTALLPVFAAEVLNVGAQGLGYLMAATGLGAVSGALIVAGLSHIVKRKLLIKVGFLSYSIFLLVFAYSGNFFLSLLAQVGIGVSFMTTVSSINTSLQASAPQEIRGRIMSLFIWALLGLYPIGSFAVGSIAKLVGSPAAVTVGATALAITSAALTLKPALLRELE